MCAVIAELASHTRHLQRHAKTCEQERAINECPNKWDEAPQTVHERTFNEHQASAAATR